MQFDSLLANIEYLRVKEDGAVSVDFVVLTAAIFLMGAIVVGTFDQEVVRIADDTGDFIARQLDE